MSFGGDERSHKGVAELSELCLFEGSNAIKRELGSEFIYAPIG